MKQQILPPGVHLKRMVAFQTRDGKTIEIPQYEKNGYDMPVQLHCDCIFFDWESKTCARPGLFIQSLGCWGDKCPSKNKPVETTKESEKDTTEHAGDSDETEYQD